MLHNVEVKVNARSSVLSTYQYIVLIIPLNSDLYTISPAFWPEGPCIWIINICRHLRKCPNCPDLQID